MGGIFQGRCKISWGNHIKDTTKWQHNWHLKGDRSVAKGCSPTSWFKLPISSTWRCFLNYGRSSFQSKLTIIEKPFDPDVRQKKSLITTLFSGLWLVTKSWQASHLLIGPMGWLLTLLLAECTCNVILNVQFQLN